MSCLLRPSAFAALFLSLVACSGGSSGHAGVDTSEAGVGGNDGGTLDGGQVVLPGLNAAPGELALRVDLARQARTNGRSNLELKMTLANGTGSEPASVNPALFQLKTSDGLYVAATVGTNHWVDGGNCDPTLSVADGASHSCVLQFDVDASLAVELHYRTANKIAGVGNDQREASAPVTLDPCTPCGTDCTYLERDADHCGKCENKLISSDEFGGFQDDITCDHGQPSCVDKSRTPCPGLNPDDQTPGVLCVDTMTDDKNCGACGVPAPNGGGCDMGKPACQESIGLKNCGGTCAELNTNDNCGACGHACSEGATCISNQSNLPSQCVFDGGAKPMPGNDPHFTTFTDGMSCSEACKALGASCWQGNDQNRFESIYVCNQVLNKPHGFSLITCDDPIDAQSTVEDVSGLCDLETLKCACVEP